MTAVYENASKPEFVHMKLQFQCPNAMSMDPTTRRITENKDRVRAGDTVTFRIGPDSYLLRRTDLKTEPVPASDWKTSNAPMLSKAGTIACNDIEIDQALHAAIKNDNFDFDGFGKRIAKLGLPADMAVIGETLPSEYLDFAWENLWWDKVADGKRPDPTGRWSTPVSEADKRAAMERLKARQQELEAGTAAIQASLLDSIKKSQADTTADLQAAQDAGKHPDGSKMNKHEKNSWPSLAVGRNRRSSRPWAIPTISARPPTRASCATAPGGNSRASPSTVRRASSVGIRAVTPSATAEFTTRPDAQGEWRVDDIVVRGTTRNGAREIRLVCEDATRPRH